jgi:hypothetical protein
MSSWRLVACIHENHQGPKVENFWTLTHWCQPQYTNNTNFGCPLQDESVRYSVFCIHLSWRSELSITVFMITYHDMASQISCCFSWAKFPIPLPSTQLISASMSQTFAAIWNQEKYMWELWPILVFVYSQCIQLSWIL